jgi:hypothetical protein
LQTKENRGDYMSGNLGIYFFLHIFLIKEDWTYGSEDGNKGEWNCGKAAALKAEILKRGKF